MEPPAEHDALIAGLRPGEISAVLPGFGLGRVFAVRALPRGSALSPKAVVESRAGLFVLKRRVPCPGGLSRVEDEHRFQADVRRAGVPVALTDHGGPSVLEHDGWVYELARFLPGEAGRADVDAARMAGRALSLVHGSASAVLSSGPSDDADPLVVEAEFERIGGGVPSRRLALESMRHDWRVAMDRLGDPGADLADAPRPLHGDFHPANLIWNDGLAGVIDFEAAGAGSAPAEVAIASLFFALDTRGGSPAAWSESPDVDRMVAFVSGYSRDGAGRAIDPSQQSWWMIQGLSAQALRRAARPGGFGRHDPAEVLKFVARVCSWIRDHADGLGVVLGDELAKGG